MWQPAAESGLRRPLPHDNVYPRPLWGVHPSQFASHGQCSDPRFVVRIAVFSAHHVEPPDRPALEQLQAQFLGHVDASKDVGMLVRVAPEHVALRLPFGVLL